MITQTTGLVYAMVVRPILATAVPGTPNDRMHPSHLAYQHHRGNQHSHHHHAHFFHHHHTHAGGDQPHTHTPDDPLFQQHAEIRNHPAVQTVA